LTVTSKAERVRKIAKMAYAQADENIGIVTFIEVGNRPSIHRHFKAGEGHVPSLIRGALLERLAMALMRLFDPPGNRKGQADPSTSERDSLPVAFALLDDPKIRKAATVRGGANKMATAIALWANLRSDSRVGRLRDARNYTMAHTITAKWSLNRAIFSDPLSLAGDTEKIVETLASGCGVAGPPLKAAAEIWEDRCKDFWARLVRTRPLQDS
jgi:hypothetical protein